MIFLAIKHHHVMDTSHYVFISFDITIYGLESNNIFQYVRRKAKDCTEMLYSWHSLYGALMFPSVYIAILPLSVRPMFCVPLQPQIVYLYHFGTSRAETTRNRDTTIPILHVCSSAEYQAFISRSTKHHSHEYSTDTTAPKHAPK